jgi:BlaI family penicillinase repressor
MPEVCISEAEWWVMNVIWNGQPMTAQDVIETLQRHHEWSPSTIKTMLHRLVRKQVLQADEQGKRYVYRTCVKRSDCVRRESRSFLRRVFAGEPVSLLAHFIKNSRLTAEEIADLRRVLDEQEARS